MKERSKREKPTDSKNDFNIYVKTSFNINWSLQLEFNSKLF